MTNLGYQVQLIDHPPSGRAPLSKGFLSKAKKLANQNIDLFADLVSDSVPLVGIEPSAILSFRDEYLRLADNKEKANHLKENTFLLEEFLVQEIQRGHIQPSDFSNEPKQLLLHGHCHQKALSSIDPTAFLLSFPENFTVKVIPAGCCGMAGSFGYERENYDLSMKIGELVLFPAVRKASSDTIIVASGTSCRHQIWDGVGKRAVHPVEVLL